MKFINKHNAEAAIGLHTYKVAINHLADLTNGEITEKLTGTITPLGYSEEAFGTNNANVALPDSVDWRDEVSLVQTNNQNVFSCFVASSYGKASQQA